MKLKSTKGISEDKYISNIVDTLIRYPDLFSIIARIFTDYNTVNSDDLDIIQEYIEDLFQSPKLITPKEETNLLSSDIKEMYTFLQERFNNAKSNILELFIYRIGPHSKGLSREQIYVEPIIQDKDIVVGESEVRCDLVFFQDKQVSLEFIECKSNIKSVMPAVLPFDEAQKSVRKKIQYFNHAYNYLRDTYSTPFIYFACYNHQVSLEVENLQKNWGFNYISILTPKELIAGLS